MKKEIIIDRSILKTWKFLENSEENFKSYDENILSHNIILTTEKIVGTVAMQTYQDKKETLKYEVTVTDYESKRDSKYIEYQFKYKDLLLNTEKYSVEKIDKDKTKVIYEFKQKPLSFKARFILLFKSKEIEQSMEMFLTNLKTHVENNSK